MRLEFTPETTFPAHKVLNNAVLLFAFQNLLHLERGTHCESTRSRCASLVRRGADPFNTALSLSFAAGLGSLLLLHFSSRPQPPVSTSIAIGACSCAPRDCSFAKSASFTTLLFFNLAGLSN